jgi:NTP pyrophosphatase (non-canonical NTP hydrolase)
MDIFEDVEAITNWIDDSNAGMSGEADDGMRLLKLVEEAGEVAEAYIGMMGQNPRKGVTHDMHDVQLELADVAITALCAIQHFTKDIVQTKFVVYEKLTKIKDRSGI